MSASFSFVMNRGFLFSLRGCTTRRKCLRLLPPHRRDSTLEMKETLQDQRDDCIAKFNSIIFFMNRRSLRVSLFAQCNKVRHSCICPAVSQPASSSMCPPHLLGTKEDQAFTHPTIHPSINQTNHPSKQFPRICNASIQESKPQSPPRERNFPLVPRSLACSLVFRCRAIQAVEGLLPCCAVFRAPCSVL